LLEPGSGSAGTLTGSYNNSNGFGGTLQGTLSGTLDNVTFDGTLSTPRVGGCIAERHYNGPVTTANISWTPNAQVNDCGGQSPLVDQPITAAAVTTPPCTFQAMLPTDPVPAAGDNRQAPVTTSGTCTWYAGSSAAWITVNSTGDHSGGGSVTFTIAPNTSTTARTATVIVASRSFTLSQDAAVTPACTYALDAQNVTMSAGGDSKLVTLTTTAGCAWSATSHDAWLTLTPPSGAGRCDLHRVSSLNDPR